MGYGRPQVTASQLNVPDGNSLVVGGASLLTVSNGDGTTALIPTVQVQGTAKTDASVLIAGFNTTNDDTVAPSLNFLKSGNATIGSNTVVASGEILGEVNFFGADGTDFKSPAASIQCLVDTTPGTGDMPGRLVLLCSADGAETPLEKVRVTGAAATALLTLGVAGTSTGSLVLSGATSGTLTLSPAAAAGSIGFILPAAVGNNGEQLTTDGNAGTATLSWAAAGSLREFKVLLGSLTDRAGDALARILGADVQAFRYRERTPEQSGEVITTGDTTTVYHGVIGDEYREVMHHGGKIFNPVSAFGETVLAIQALAERLQRIETLLAGGH